MGVMMGDFNIDEFRGHLAISKIDLDEDIMQQPSLYHKVGVEWGLACSERDYIKAELTLVKADLYRWHRKKLENKEGKVTEAMVDALIIREDEYQDINDEFIDANHRVQILESLKDSFYQRSFMLRDLAQLAVAHFFERDAVKGMEDAARSTKFERSKKAIAKDRKKRRTRVR